VAVLINCGVTKAAAAWCGGVINYGVGVVAAAAQGAAEKKPKKPANVQQCTCVLYLARIELLYTYDDVIFLIAFLSSPHRETPKNALKRNR
jgi:hypothetical protein